MLLFSFAKFFSFVTAAKTGKWQERRRLTVSCTKVFNNSRLQRYFAGGSSVNDASLQDSDVDANELRQSPSSRKRYDVELSQFVKVNTEQ